MLGRWNRLKETGNSMVSSGMKGGAAWAGCSCSTNYSLGGKNWMDFVTVLVSLACSSGVNARNFIPAF